MSRRWISNESLAETIDKVSRVPKESAVLFISILRDEAGRSTSSVDVVRDPVRVSKAPVYGVSSQFLDAGVVGGATFDFAANERRTADLVTKALRGHWIPYGKRTGASYPPKSGLVPSKATRVLRYWPFHGLGVGLAIVQSIITSHGEELAAMNAKGGGACVHFSLPAISEETA